MEDPRKHHTHECSRGSTQIGISIFKQPHDWVQQCVQSALIQEGPGPIEITVRTDGQTACTNETLHWLRKLRTDSSRFFLIEGLEQLGTFASYREIFGASNSEFLCQLDADDWLEPGAIRQGVELLSRQISAPFIYTDCREVSPAGDDLGVRRRSRTSYDKDRMLVEFITFHLRIIRRRAYIAIGGYKPNLLYAGDYDLSLRLSELGAPIRLPKALYNYRLHVNNTSRIKHKATMQEAFKVAHEALARRQHAHLFDLRLDEKQQNVIFKRRNGPILISGMHRSGTSLLALIMESLGLDLGKELIAGDEQNPDGYGEDLAAVNLQRQAIQRQYKLQHGEHSREGWPDWGWHEGSRPSWTHQPDKLWHEAAHSYLNSRKELTGPWGWKDPRSALFLESWLELEPGLRLIAIYRDPWAVVDALQRIKPAIFANHTDWALSIWSHYNKTLLRFANRHPERCIVIHSSTLITSPELLIDILVHRWNWPLPKSRQEHICDIKSLIRRDRLGRGPAAEKLPALHRYCSPNASALLDALESIADAPFWPGKRINSSVINTPLSLMRQWPRPDLAIIITSHNQGDLLLEALASAEQSCGSHKVELLIVDDGSTQPRTIEVLKHVDELGYNVIKQSNKGLSAARNTGIAQTTAPIILFLDDDNRLTPEYFESGLEIISHYGELDAVYGNFIKFGLTNGIRRVGTIKPSALWEMNRIDNCALMRRSFLERCCGYDTLLPAFEDWDLWLTALGQGEGLRLGYLDATCFEYRVRPGSMLQRLLNNPQLHKEVIEYLQQKHGKRVGHG